MSHHPGSLTIPSRRGRPLRRGMAAALTAALLASMTVAWPAPARAVEHLTISIASTAGSEVDEGDDDGTAQISFKVSIDEGLPPEQDIVFEWETQDGTAVADGDYDAVSGGTGTIQSPVNAPPNGETDTTITVDVNGDIDIEGDETFTVHLVAVTSGPAKVSTTAGDAEATGTITDDDPKVSVTGTVVDVAEGGTAEVGIGLTAPAQQETTVTYTVTGDTVTGNTATATDDYTPPASGSGEVKIPANASTATIEVPTVQDADPEDHETFTVTITDITPGDEGADLDATVTILDDEPRVTIADAEIVEGHVASTFMAFTLRVDPPADGPVSVLVETDERDDPSDPNTAKATEGTAGSLDADDDYVAASRTLTMDAENGFEETFLVQVLGDVDGAYGDHNAEIDETFFVDVSNVDGPAWLPSGTSAIGTIRDDDELPVISVDDASVEEGDPGDETTMEFTVRLSHPSGRDIVLEYSTSDGPPFGSDLGPAFDGVRTDSAIEDHDYDAVPGDDPGSDRFRIPAGATEKNVPVTIVPDGMYELDEGFRIALNLAGDVEDNPPFELAPTTGEGPTRGATGTIVNDEPKPTITAADRAAPEGDEGSTATRNVEVRLSHPSSVDVSVDYVTRDGTATAEDDDYSPTSGTITYDANEFRGLPGPTRTWVQVDNDGDDVPEPNEHFFVDLVNPSNGQLADDGSATAEFTLLNDDSPRLTIDDVEVEEGDSGTTDAVFTVTVVEPGDAETGDDISVDWTTVDASAVAGRDYQAASGTLDIAAGETTGTITVKVIGDPKDEPTRAFELHLGDAVGATVFDGVGQALIRDDDEGRPTAAIAAPASGAVEGSSVTLDGSESADPDGEIVSYEWDLGDGSDPVTSSSPTVIHTYDDDGTYTVTLTVTDDEDLTATTTREVAVANVAPTVEAGPDTAVEVRGSVTLQGSATDPGDDELTYTWDLGDGSEPVTGAEVTHTYTDVGKHTVTLTVSDGDGGEVTDTLVVDVAADVGPVDRLSGDNRITTALEVSRAGWPSPDDGTPASRDVVLATAWNYPDALAGGTLAALLGAPILLTDTDQLPAAVATELERLGSTRVWILGGEAAISQAVAQAAAGDGRQVFRLEGSDRFETATAVARATGASRAGEVVIALGAHEVPDRAWPDAVSAGALSSAPDAPPVLLTLPDSLPASTEQALADVEATTVYVVGGEGAIAPAVADRLTELGYEVVRLAGKDRYATSLAVAELALSRHDAESDPAVVFATGAAFPDGLTATALAARLSGLVVLVPHGEVPETTGTFLTDGADRFDQGAVVGGTAVVSEAVRELLEAAITRT